MHTFASNPPVSIVLPFVVRQFQTSGLDATKICFEITETSAIASYAQASRFINAL